MKTDKYQIRWQYGCGYDGHANTLCKLFLNNEPDVFMGLATCHEKDRPCKDKGRRISLQRAMTEAGLSKEERKEVWEAYRRMKPKGRW